MPRPRRLRRVILVLLLSWCTAAVLLDSYGRFSHPRGTWDAIVVAGCRVNPDGQPSLALRRRTEVAVDLWKAGRASVLVFTGGVGENAPAEAMAAATWARGLGVPLDAMRLEDASTSTEENARFTAERYGYRRVLVVTDTYHVFRARRVFGRFFPEVAGVGAVGPRSSRVPGALREVPALAIYALLGRL